MGDTTENKPKKHICAALLAHVDAGKTTLSEAMLYESGSIRSVGRVDKGSAFLDTFALEKARGITIFSKQAILSVGGISLTLLDTPGHMDFSAEMERTLGVLDYAILVISATDGVQAHTQTLWRLLKRYNIPVFLFVNKMDQAGTCKEQIVERLRHKLHEGCVAYEDTPAFYEQVALSDETSLEAFLLDGTISDDMLGKLILERKVFPCFFGSALKMQGVDRFLKGLSKWIISPEYTEAFGAQVFKIARDEKGVRLAHMKIMGGTLAVKHNLPHTQEKVNQIRLYSGGKYEAITQALPGMVCAVPGLDNITAGMSLGEAEPGRLPVLEPVLHYKVILPVGVDAGMMLPKLRELEEEDPLLHLEWNETLQEIQAKLMGEVQTEVLKSLVLERFGIAIEFGAGSIVYKETIANIVEGVGHFEPLRHYAEVHLILESGEVGSGLVFERTISEDLLDRNWQHLILSHLEEREHRGVLTGSAITDIKITLVAGRAHNKHTEGGDFRQATFRAVRQGLMQAESVLLEPYYDFCIEVPEEIIGRAMSDVERMQGTFEAPVLEHGIARLEGKVPAVNIQGYQQEMQAYTKGEGRLSLVFGGYAKCHNAEAVIAQIGYEAEADTEYLADSIFCAHGAGNLVPWNQVKEHMHLESCLNEYMDKHGTKVLAAQTATVASTYQEGWIDTQEVDQIIARTFQANTKEKNGSRKRYTKEKIQITAPAMMRTKSRPKEKQEEYLLIDGYNVIYAWEDLKELAKESIDGARGKLLDVMCNYQGIRGGTLIVVFDAYRVERHLVEMLSYHNIHVVYTQEAQTADQYIEQFAQKNAKQYLVTVATSDYMEQIITRGQGCALLSARELEQEVKRVNEGVLEAYRTSSGQRINKLADVLEGKQSNP